MNNFSRLKALDAQNVPITVEDREKIRGFATTIGFSAFP
jgi:hypothetical protein